MNKIIATLGLAIMATSIAGSALALNPQPLPPGRTHSPILEHRMSHRHHHHHPVVHARRHDHRK